MVSNLKRGLTLFIYASIILSIILVGSITGFIIQIKRQLPDLSMLKEYEPSLITRVYSADGQSLAYFCLEKRILVPYSSLPPHLIKAIIAVEDANFYNHRGLEWGGILRAAFRNIKHGGFVEGGSTITQQLTRSLLLHSEKKIIRKFKEALLALELEKVYPKEKILEMYLNQIYFGKGAYGIEAAARTFFGKHVEDLDLEEAALLAGLPKAPNNYNPFTLPQRALARRNHVLQRMAEEGFIDEKTRRDTAKIPIAVTRVEPQTIQAPYFVEYVRRYIEEKYGSTALYRGGLKVYTTLDLEAQRHAEAALRWGIEQLDKRQGFRPIPDDSPLTFAHEDEMRDLLGEYEETKQVPSDLFLGEVLAVEPTQAVVRLEDTNCIGILDAEDAAWAKAPSLQAILHPGQRIYTRIVGRLELPEEEESPPDEQPAPSDPNAHAEADIPRYQLALEQIPEVQGALMAIDPRSGWIKAMVGGYDFRLSKFNRAVQARRQPGSAFKPFIYETALRQGYTLADIFIDSPIIYQDETQNKDWKPVNYYQKFFGPTTLREALEKSRNVITIKLLKKVGIEETIETARQAGIVSPLAPDLSLALGSSGVSLLELTSAYGVFAAGGMRAKPFAILRIEGPEGQVMEESQPQPKKVLDEQTSYLMTQALIGVVDHGTGWRAKSLGRPIAGKTGTTNNYVDAWFIGYTPDVVTGVWVGFDEYRSLGDMETGSRAASPIWVQFMKECIEDTPIQAFAVPNGIKFIPIDRKTGLVATKECPAVIMEAFREGNEPKELCNSHRIAQEHFVSIDMDLSKNDRMPDPHQSPAAMTATPRISSD
ncbi:MAG: penicillin-binding protein 1A [bacterium]